MPFGSVEAPRESVKEAAPGVEDQCRAATPRRGGIVAASIPGTAR